MNKLNITGNTFPLTVENLELLQKQNEVLCDVLSAILPDSKSTPVGLREPTMFINKVFFYNGEIYPIQRGGSSSYVFLVEKRITINTDTATYPDVRILRYAVSDKVNSDEVLIHKFLSWNGYKTFSLASELDTINNNITTAQQTAETAVTKAQTAQQTADEAQLHKTYLIKGYTIEDEIVYGTMVVDYGMEEIYLNLKCIANQKCTTIFYEESDLYGNVRLINLLDENAGLPDNNGTYGDDFYFNQYLIQGDYSIIDFHLYVNSNYDDSSLYNTLINIATTKKTIKLSF